MKNILAIVFVLFALNVQAQYVIDEEPIRGSIEVVSETEGKEFSFPVLETPYNLANPPTYKFFYFGKETSGQEESAEIKSENVAQNFVGIGEFLESEGYKDLATLKKAGLKLYFVKEKSNNGNNGKRR